MTNYTHTPAHAYVVPDEYMNPYSGHTYYVTQDEWADDPREEWGDDVIMAPYHSPYSLGPAYNDVTELFQETYGRTGNETLALTVTQRLMRLSGDNRTVTLFRYRGYVQSDWADYVVFHAPNLDPASYLREFEMWVRGDVYKVDCDCGETLYGIYADSMEEAVNYFANVACFDGDC